MNTNQNKSNRNKIDEQYEPEEEYYSENEECIQSKPKRSRKVQKQHLNIKHSLHETNNRYFWTEVQNERYKEFLEQNYELMVQNLKERKLAKINVRISKHVITRTSHQCRSHHQKMLKRFGTISNIIFQLSKQHLSEKNQEQRTVEIKEDTETVPSPTVQLREVIDFQVTQEGLWDRLIDQKIDRCLWNCK